MRGAAAFLVLAAGCAPDAPPRPPPAELAAPFTALAFNGERVSLARYRGKVLLLNFWASWCGYCRKEIPHLNDLQSELGTQGLAVVGVSTDTRDEKLHEFLSEKEVRYPVARFNDLFERGYGPIQAVPLTVVIDREGRVRERLEGYQSRETLARIARRLLAE